MSVLSKPYFHDEAAAFRHLESVLWPDAPVRPHCGSVKSKHYDLGKTRLGLRKRAEKACRKQLTVKVGTVFEQAHKVRSFHVPSVTVENVRPIIAKNADRASTLMTDESPIYPKVGKTFGFHGTVNHSANEYVRLGAFIHINTAESFFSIVKRGNMGVYHSVSEAHQGSIW